MSFGFGISDFVTVPQLAWQVYSSLKDAPEDHKNLLDDVLSLHEVLTQVDDKVERQKDSLDAREWAQLQDITKRCKEALEDIRNMLQKYRMDGRGKTWSRVKFAGKDTTPIRTRIAAQIDRLNAFNCFLLLSAQTRTERKIDKIIATLKHRGSVVSIESVASIMDEDRGWKIFGRALQDQGITLQMVQERHESFVGLLAEAVIRVNTQESTTDSEESPIKCDIVSVIDGINLDSLEDPVAEVEKDFTKFAPYATDILRKTLAYEVDENTKPAKNGNGKTNPKSLQQRKNISSILHAPSARDDERSSEAQRRGCLRLGASVCRIAKSPRMGVSTRESALGETKTLYTPSQFKNVLQLFRAICRGEADTISRLELIASMDSAETHGQLLASRFALLLGRPEILMILLSTDPSDIQRQPGKTWAADFEDILCQVIDMSIRCRQQWPPSTSPSDALKAASCVIGFWHDKGLCDIMQTTFLKTRGPFGGKDTNRQRRIADDPDSQALVPPTPDVCTRCSSLLTSMVASIVEARSLDGGPSLPAKLFHSSSPAALKMVLNEYTSLFMKEMLGYGSNILQDREMRKNAIELGIM